MKKALSLLLVSFILLTVFQSAIFAEEDIKVVIDGDELIFDVAPEIINGRTMVPLRAIFEYFGADVTWNQGAKTIRSSVGNVSVSMQVENPKSTINGERVTLDSPPVIIDGRTLVPVRVIAEAFSAKVSWDGDTKTVIIETPYPKNAKKPVPEFDKYHLVTSCGDFEYFDFSISKNKLKISGKIDNEENSSILIKIGDINERIEVGKKGIYNATLNLDNAEIDEFGFLSIYTNVPGALHYTSYTFDSIKIIKDGKSYYFEKPLVYDNNVSLSEKWVTPLAYTNYEIDERVINLSNEICSGTDSDYEKLKALHTWVCENIYYDYDYYYDKSNRLYYSDTEVIESKRTVCAGYTNLLLSLIRAQGIPARSISGHALGLGSRSKFWDENSSDIKESNHAWIQAYADNRWINIDATWDSGNKYQNGEFNYEGLQNYLHFDITDAMMAMDHKFLTID